MEKIGFIGLGIMGSRMASHLVKSSHLTVYNRDAEKAKPLVVSGANATTDLASLAAEKDIVFTMLSTPEVVKEVAFGENGFVKYMRPGMLWVDCSTVDPVTSSTLGNQARALGINFLDAPVAGTKQPAENGELVFFVGGSSEDVAKAAQYFDLMGKKTIHVGAVSSGASMKMIVNLMLGQSMQAYSEAVKLGKTLNLETDQIHNVLMNTPVVAPFIRNVEPKLTAMDRSANFPLKWMSKDLNLASNLGKSNEISLPLTENVANTFEAAASQGYADEDFSSIYHYIEKLDD